jgi:hypothetical protein
MGFFGLLFSFFFYLLGLTAVDIFLFILGLTTTVVSFTFRFDDVGNFFWTLSLGSISFELVSFFDFDIKEFLFWLFFLLSIFRFDGEELPN